MDKRKNTRRLAMQVLYQIDVTGNADAQAILGELDEEHDPLDVREAATELALAAWSARNEADAAVRDLAPEWPTHRQPPVDRAILRLAHHEMTTGRVPFKIAINEAIELAKHYGGEQSPSFVNGVLDKIARQLPPPPENAPESSQDTPREASPDAWLKDATGDRTP